MLRRIAGSVLVAALVAAPCLASAETTTLTVAATDGPIDRPGRSWPTLDVAKLFNGQYNRGTVVPIEYSATVVGLLTGDVPPTARRLNVSIGEAVTRGDVVVVGMSQGAVVIAEAKRLLMARSEASERPDPRHLEFVSVADPFRPRHGSLINVFPHLVLDTPYDSTYVTHEYDGVADLPDRPNPLAVENAAAGGVEFHTAYLQENDTRPRVTTRWVNSAGGTVTDILILAPHLPMLTQLRGRGLPTDWLEKTLRPQVDAGYSRNDPKPEAATKQPIAVHESSVADAPESGTDDASPARHADSDSEAEPPKGESQSNVAAEKPQSAAAATTRGKAADDDHPDGAGGESPRPQR